MHAQPTHAQHVNNAVVFRASSAKDRLSNCLVSINLVIYTKKNPSGLAIQGASAPALNATSVVSQV